MWTNDLYIIYKVVGVCVHANLTVLWNDRLHIEAEKGRDTENHSQSYACCRL